MSQGRKMPLADAERIAAQMLLELEPAIDRGQVVGSVRRRKAEVGDIELLLIPRRDSNLFGDPDRSHVDPVLEMMRAQGRVMFLRNGPAYKQLGLIKPQVKLDLFLSTPERWPVELIVRTGPAEFSKRLVTPRSQGGMLPEGWKVADGWTLYDADGHPVGCSSERAVFEAIGEPWREPWERQ